MGLLQHRIQAGLHSSTDMHFPAKSFGFEAVALLSAQNQRFSLVAEIPKKCSWARAQQQQNPTFLCALTDTALALTTSTAPGNARHRPDCSHRHFGYAKCEPGWATQPQELRAIPGLGRCSVAVLTNEGLGFQVLFLQHTNSVQERQQID